MKILSAEQVRQADAYTIASEPIASIDLMERASGVFTNWFKKQFPDEDRRVIVFCGPGNNGGDGLAVARMLYRSFYDVKVCWCRIGNSCSEDFSINLERLPGPRDLPLFELPKGAVFPKIDKNTIVIDAIFGSGLNRAVTGYWGELFEHINQSGASIASIDIPSGLFADQSSTGACIHADASFSFEFPKLAFLFPENFERVGAWYCGSIGLSKKFIADIETSFYLVDHKMAVELRQKRNKFDHKGKFGHALLIMGSYGKIGAALLAAKSCLRTGAGLVSVHVPGCANEILQSGIPEAMLSLDKDKYCFSEVPDLEPWAVVGTGCGLGQNTDTKEALFELLRGNQKPMVLDADALNLIAAEKEILQCIPKNSIITPHPKEFERLFGKAENDFARNKLQRQQAVNLGIYIVLKGAHTAIACPDGTCYFNTTGNPGMATAGSGDVLTGIITALVAQAYLPREAAILGVYLHGLAGDLALKRQSEESLIAGDIVENMGAAFKKMSEEV